MKEFRLNKLLIFFVREYCKSFILIWGIIIFLSACGGDENNASNSNNLPDGSNYKMIDVQNFSDLQSEEKAEILNTFQSSNPVVLKNPTDKSINDLLDHLDLDIPIIVPNSFHKIKYYGIDVDDNEYWEFVYIVSNDVTDYNYLSMDDSELSYTLINNEDDLMEYNYNLSNWLNENNRRIKLDNDLRRRIKTKANDTDVDENFLRKKVRYYYTTQTFEDYDIFQKKSRGLYTFKYYVTSFQSKKESGEVLDWFILEQYCDLSPKTEKDENEEDPQYINYYIKEYNITIGKDGGSKFSDLYKKAYPGLEYPKFVFCDVFPKNKIEESKVTYTSSYTFQGSASAELNASIGTEGIGINGKIAANINLGKQTIDTVEYSIENVKKTSYSNSERAKWEYIMDDSKLKKYEEECKIVFPAKLSWSTFNPKHTCIFYINSEDVLGLKSVNIPIVFSLYYKTAFTLPKHSNFNPSNTNKVITNRLPHEEKLLDYPFNLALRLTPNNERQLDYKIYNWGPESIKCRITRGLVGQIKKCEWHISPKNDSSKKEVIEDNMCIGMEHTFFIDDTYIIKLLAIDKNNVMHYNSYGKVNFVKMNLFS